MDFVLAFRLLVGQFGHQALFVLEKLIYQIDIGMWHVAA